MKRVVVGLSGGVDSSVSAYLLKKQGYEVIGVFMKNWHDDSVTILNECPWLEDSNDAMIVAEKLQIPFQVIDFSKQYKERIINYMFDEYEKGRTPNPDILCNKEIKFDVFLNTALQLGADYVATGHYCRKEKEVIGGKTIFRLLVAKDSNKDQSYFLCQLSQKQLANSLFPIGALTKFQVREIAKKIGLITAEKKDSQGLCFVGKIKLPKFLQQKLKPKTGSIILISSDFEAYGKQIPNFKTKEAELNYFSAKTLYTRQSGKEVGTHQGAYYFTKGQRKGLDVGGTKEGLYVIETDIIENIVYVGEGKNHPGLYKSVLCVSEEATHWVRKDLELKPNEKLEVKARFRYNQALKTATIYKAKSGLYVEFKSKQSAIQEGQFVAWYKNEELLGSGVIS